MLVTKTIDNLGRIVIPNDYKKALKMKNGDEINIELNDNKIIISKAKNDSRVERIKNELDSAKKLRDNARTPDEKNVYIGYVLALKWLLEEE